MEGAVNVVISRTGQGKIGAAMSDCRDRIVGEHGRNHSYAYMLYTIEELRAMIETEWVDSVKELGLPGLNYHVDHDQYLPDEIRFVLGEATGPLHTSVCISFCSIC